MKSILSAVVGAMLAFSAIDTGAQVSPGERQVSLTIETDTLAAALDKWAQQSGFQIFIQDWEATKNLSAKSLKGTFTAQEALEQLLSGTSLTYIWISDKAVSIRKKTAQTVPTALQRTSLDGSVPLARPVGDEAPGFGAAHSASGPTDRVRERETLEELIVTGSRLRRVEPPPAVVIFDQDRIQQLGATSIANVLDYLPQQSFVLREGTSNASSRTIRLRGLGVGTTLVLINGRRTVTSALQGAGNFFDINSIPLAAVDRIEILSDSASAIYGTDAVGGVVNVILKNALTVPALDVFYGASDGGADERRVALTLGGAGERWRGSVVLDFFGRSFLMGNERDLSNDQDYTRFGGLDQRLPYANPGTVKSVTGDNLPGLPAPFAAIPPGDGIDLVPADFTATAGQANLESINRFRSIVPKARQYSGLAQGEFDVTDSTTAFADLLYTDRHDESLDIPNLLAFTFVPETNPFNPFGEPVFVDYLLTEFQPHSVSKSEFMRGVVGLRGQIGSWDWELAVLGSDEDGSSRLDGYVDPVRLAAAAFATDPSEALNLFASHAPASAAVLSSLLADPITDRNSSRALQAGAFGRGPIAQVPAGPIDLVLGLEGRKEKVHFESRSIGLMLSEDRDTSAAYSEVRVPLVSGSMQVPGARSISLTLAARFDEYSDFGGTFNPQYGIEWSPVENIVARVAYGTSFRAPSLYELYSPVTEFVVPLPDPRRNDEATPLSIAMGGNRNLEPEESDSLSAGIAFTSPTHRTRVAATYWRIEQDQRVQTLQSSLLLANEALFANRIVRAAPTPSDIAAGLPGRLLRIDASSINYGRLETDGVDLQLSSPFDTALGQFVPNLNVTWVHSYKAADFPGTTALERVGVANLLAGGTIPRLRATAGLAWSIGAATLATNLRYVDSYDDANIFGIRNGRQVGSQTLADIQGSMELGRLWNSRSWYLDDVVVRAGVTNLLDKEPPHAEVGGINGFDITQGDPRERFGYLSVQKMFR